jgi:pimeloyl-ACP methyl ester carboxylesterase
MSAAAAAASGLVLALLSLGAAQAETITLKVPGFRPSVVVPPTAQKGRRPVVVALHGNFDRAEWSCEALPTLVQGRAWLVCIRGVPRGDTPGELNRWTYGARSRVMAEINAALKALEARYPGRVDSSTPLLAGFSLGAIYSARFAVRQPARFPRLYLVEGSHKVWTAASMRRFARKGGKAVLFGCGRRGCGAWSRRLCRAFTRLKVRCAEVTVPGLGHSYTDPLPQRALPRFREMVAEDPRFGRVDPGVER